MHRDSWEYFQVFEKFAECGMISNPEIGAETFFLFPGIPGLEITGRVISGVLTNFRINLGPLKNLSKKLIIFLKKNDRISF